MAHEDTSTLQGERTPLLQDQQDLSANSPPPSKFTASNTVSRSDLIWILGGLWGPVFLGALDGTIVATLLSPIGSYFKKSNQASYLGTSYLLSVAVCTPLYGRLSDILGRKGAMLLGLFLFAIGTLFCGISPSMELLIASRAIAGMGGGGVMTVSSIAVTDLVPLKQRGLYQGMANIVYGLGAGIGGPLGGWVNDTFGWRFAFLMQIPPMAISFAVITWKVNIPLPPAVQHATLSEKLRRIDYLGALTLVFTIGCFLLPISLKNTEDIPWGHPIVWGLLLASLVAVIGFILAEAKWSTYPILPLRLITQRTPLFVALTNFCISIVSFSMLYNVPLYFAAVRLATATEAGSHLLPNSIALATGSLFAGWIMRLAGKYWLLCVLSNVIIMVSSLLVTFWNDSTGWFELWFDIVPSGFGFCSVLTSTLIAMVASVRREDVAVATGITYLFRTVAQVLGVSLSGALVQGVLLRELRRRINTPGSDQIIEKIRHSTAYIRTLEPGLQMAAVESYKSALRIVFFSQTVVAFLGVLCALPIQEFSLPGSPAEQEEAEQRNSGASHRTT